jgi:hypothetical protein
MEGNSHALRSAQTPSSYIPNNGLNLNHDGGGTYSGNSVEPSIQDFENVFGPAARNLKDDLQRYKRHGRWHLPDILKGPNNFLTDRIDGLITDATSSPFTGKILPYKYFDNVDGKLKWNVWSFDEGMASRVPYEAPARTLTQTKRSFSAYAVRHGLAITMEHNFMMTPKGRENFQNQLNQLVGSIQYTNDLDVHMALIQAPSYEKHVLEKYNNFDMSPITICREYVDMFGFMQKSQNALDILIEEAKKKLKSWGGPMPDFLLTNSKLTFQLTMTPERTNYITQGPEGVKRLRQGPDINTYRGINIIPSRAFSTETGQIPRDVLRRRVRVAEYYRIKPHAKNPQRTWQLYDEGKDSFFTLDYNDLFKYATLNPNGSDDDDFFNVVGYEKTNTIVVPSQENDDYDINQQLGTLLTISDTHNTVNELKDDYTRIINILKKHTEKIKEINHTVKTNMETIIQLMITKKILKDKNDQNINNFNDIDHFLQHFNDLEFTTPVASKMQLHSEERITSWKNMMSTVDRHMTKIYRQNPDTVGPEELHKALEKQALPLPHDHILATFVKNNLVFAPFVQNMGFMEKNELRAQINKSVHANIRALLTASHLDHVPEHIAEMLEKSIVPYPRACKAIASPSKLYNPLTHETVERGTVEYNEGRVANARLFRRYAAPLQYLQKITASNSPQLAFDLRSLTKTSHYIDVLYMQPLGAVFEPNHPMHMSAAASGGCKDLHDSWILTDEVLSYMYHHPERWPVAAQVALDTFVDTSKLAVGDLPTKAAFSCMVNENIVSAFQQQGWHPVHNIAQNLGVYTWGVHDNYTSQSDYLNPTSNLNTLFHAKLKNHAKTGVVTNEYLKQLDTLYPATDTETRSKHPWLQTVHVHTAKVLPPSDEKVLMCLKHRMEKDAYTESAKDLQHSTAAVAMLHEILSLDSSIFAENSKPATVYDGLAASGVMDLIPASLSVQPQDKNGEWGDDDDPNNGSQRRSGPIPPPLHPSPSIPNSPKPPTQFLYNNVVINPTEWEFVIIRPNIEHYMMGIIMGLAGDNLGNTLWGQTELSVYDDSQHGVWGMSYKYHERAIVFNEKNLIRMWDIAYDGYNGGKDDTYVQWYDQHKLSQFKEDTNDMTKDYHGASMMVMAFYHKGGFTDPDYKNNWPSPIVFYDDCRSPHNNNMGICYGSENQSIIPVNDFRVFHSNVYKQYKYYYDLMPRFQELHGSRKDACASTTSDETQTDMLAFQGTLQVFENGFMQQINGSGHHGVDYVGVASIRAGKGHKFSTGITNVVRQI